MKRFAPLPVFLLLVTFAVSQPADKGVLPASVAFELAEYGAKRTEGLNKLKELAKTQLQVVLKDQMSEGKLEAANAINKAVAALPITSPENATPPAGLPSAAVLVLKDHASKVFAGISGLNNQFIPRLDKVKVELLKSGDLPGANAADAKIRELREEAEKLMPPKLPAGAKQETVESFTVEALIDGGSELHVTKEGVYWMVPGGEAKPGLHDGANEPTYVSGSRWKPKWRVKGTRGPDTSDVYLMKTSSPKLIAETVLVSRERFGKNENRTPVATSVKEDHFVVTISDPEGGSRWYKIRIKSVP
ncbi:MAG: y domain 1 [Prosthecobacter sp.]|nr:y domain 1 [Prosthecobacter sp.]